MSQAASRGYNSAAYDCEFERRIPMFRWVIKQQLARGRRPKVEGKRGQVSKSVVNAWIKEAKAQGSSLRVGLELESKDSSWSPRISPLTLAKYVVTDVSTISLSKISTCIAGRYLHCWEMLAKILSDKSCTWTRNIFSITTLTNLRLRYILGYWNAGYSQE